MLGFHVSSNFSTFLKLVLTQKNMVNSSPLPNGMPHKKHRSTRKSDSRTEFICASSHVFDINSPIHRQAEENNVHFIVRYTFITSLAAIPKVYSSISSSHNIEFPKCLVAIHNNNSIIFKSNIFVKKTFNIITILIFKSIVLFKYSIYNNHCYVS